MRLLLRFLNLALGLGLAAVVGTQAFSALRDAADTSGLVAQAARVESEAPISLEAVRAGAQRADTRIRSCDETVTRAAATMALADLQSRNQATDYEGWARALPAADRVIRHAIVCAPHDGNLWARLVLLEQAAVGGTTQIARLAHLSHALAPAEIGVIRARAELWRTAATLPAGLDEIREQDLGLILAYATPKDAVAMLQGAHGATRQAADALLASQSPNRQRALRHAGLFASPADAPKMDGTFDTLFHPPPPATR